MRDRYRRNAGNWKIAGPRIIVAVLIVGITLMLAEHLAQTMQIRFALGLTTSGGQL
jgi:hypothetical protein